MNYHKFWLRSKTLLFNLAVTMAGLWTMVEGSASHLRQSMTPENYGLLMTAVGIIGIILRVVTTRGVTLYRAPESK